jgi:hypothetical protein
MIVFMRNIPDDTTRQEIIDFLMPTVKGGIFRAKGKITSIDILAIKDNNTSLTEYHGLAHIMPDQVGQRVIKKLHGQPFKGKRIALHEYIERSWKNDRRDPTKPSVPVAGERRAGQVRRTNLKIQKLKSIKRD